jgi:hypothetical protein
MNFKSLFTFSNLTYLIAAGAIVLFTIGYVAHALLGDDNTVEEISEELLEKEYHIEVEFTRKKKEAIQ